MGPLLLVPRFGDVGRGEGGDGFRAGVGHTRSGSAFGRVVRSGTGGVTRVPVAWGFPGPCGVGKGAWGQEGCGGG